MNRIFILSPANCGGKRAKMLLRREARFELAQRFQRGESVPLAEAFSFLSGLYFRGKFRYARRFARPPEGQPGVLIITPDRGLLSETTAITRGDLEAFASVSIDVTNQEYVRPLLRDANALARQIRPESQIVLLGSISTWKYVDVLQSALGDRLFFPAEFVGRGDMSRGGLLLRMVKEDLELEYWPIARSVRKAKRPVRIVSSHREPSHTGEKESLGSL